MYRYNIEISSSIGSNSIIVYRFLSYWCHYISVCAAFEIYRVIRRITEILECRKCTQQHTKEAAIRLIDNKVLTQNLTLFSSPHLKNIIDMEDLHKWVLLNHSNIETSRKNCNHALAVVSNHAHYVCFAISCDKIDPLKKIRVKVTYSN